MRIKLPDYLRFTRRNTWFSLMILFYLLFSYYYFGAWWHSSVGSGLIILCAYFIWKKDFLNQIGLNLSINTILKTIVLVITVAVASYFLMVHLAHKYDVVIRYSHWHNYYHDIFYILNEEIILGAIILFGLLKKNIKPIVASISLAIFFSIVHFVFYKWIFDDKGIISITTLVTLFLVGYVRNYLIITTKHIGYSWALHFGWMVIMFGCNHTQLNTIIELSESVRFNMYLGSIEMLFVSIVLAAISTILMLTRKTVET